MNAKQIAYWGTIAFLAFAVVSGASYRVSRG
jgi:hypothetical protein